MKPGIIKTRSSSATSPARQCSLARDSAKGTLMPTKPIPTPSIPTDPSAADLSALVRFFSCTGVDFLESRFNAICQPLFALVFQHPANAQFWIRPQTKLSSDCNPQTGFWATQPGVRDVTSIHIAFFIRRSGYAHPASRCSGLALLRAQARHKQLVRRIGINRLAGGILQRLLEIVPAAHAGLERDHIGVTHLLHHVCDEGGTVTGTADHHDLQPVSYTHLTLPTIYSV